MNTSKVSLPHDVDIRYAEFCSPWDIETDGDVEFRKAVSDFIALELVRRDAQWLGHINKVYEESFPFDDLEPARVLNLLKDVDGKDSK